VQVAKYKLSAAILNRKKSPGKTADGQALSFTRNADGSLSAFQRVKIHGKDKDTLLEKIPAGKEITEIELREIRERGFALKLHAAAGEPLTPAMTFSELWGGFVQEVTTAENPIWADNTRIKTVNRMRAWIAPTPLWKAPLDQITPQDIGTAVSALKIHRPKLVITVLLDMSRAFTWGQALGHVKNNPARAYRDMLRTVERGKTYAKHPATTDLAKMGEILNAIRTGNLSFSVRACLEIQAYTALRSGEIAGARWEELDMASGTWRIPRSRMKMKGRHDTAGNPLDHVLVLPPEVVFMLERLPRTSEWMFPSSQNPAKHIHKELLPQGLIRLGFQNVLVPHGWRSSLKTLAARAVSDDGRPLFAPQWVEDLLDHQPKGIESHYLREPDPAGVARVLAWWAQQLTQVAGGQ
jgi:integrase